MVRRVAVHLVVAIDVGPLVLHLAHPIDAFAPDQVHVALVAGASGLAALLAHAPLGRVSALAALAAVVFRRLLIDEEITVRWAKLALARARLAVAQVAGVALGQPVGVAPAHRDRLDLRFHELGEGDRVVLRVAPHQVVEAFGDLVHRVLLPIVHVQPGVLLLHDVVDDELEDAEGGRLVANRVLSVLELHLALLIEVDRICQVKIDQCVVDVRLIRLERGARARPGRAVLVLVLLLLATTGHVDLAAGLHAKGHHVAIVTAEAERAHSAIDQDAALAHAIRVSRALVAPIDGLVVPPVHRRILAVLARVMAGQAENGLGRGVNTLIHAAELHDFAVIARILVHRHVRHEVKMSYKKQTKVIVYQLLPDTYHFSTRCRRHTRKIPLANRSHSRKPGEINHRHWLWPLRKEAQRSFQFCTKSIFR